MILNHPQIIDSTLREGEQTPGVTFSESTKRAIIAGLHQVGIDEIELGIASVGHSHLVQLITDARRLTQGACRLGLWCRCLEEDIVFAASCRPDVLSLSIPVSDSHIRDRLRKNRAWVKETLAQSIRQALAAGIPSVSVGFEDASRAPLHFLLELAKIAEQNGAQRVRLADTVGICSPEGIRKLIQALKNTVQLEVAVHCHNDFGMATANSIAALEAGAQALDATVLGLGERAGNCRLEEVVGYLTLVLGSGKYSINRLSSLCQDVAKAAQKRIPDNHPLVGSEIFTCESGLHQHGLTVNPTTYEPYAPERVGKKSTLRFGKKTGKKAVTLQLEQQGIRLDEAQTGLLLHRIRSGEQTLSKGQLLRLAVEDIHYNNDAL